MTVDIELKASLNTDTFAQSLTKFGEVGDNLINTGIERLGGITNIYEKESTYAQTGERVYTEDGKEISLTDSSVADYQILSLDGVAVGQVSEYGVEKTTVLDACDDSFLDSNSYTTAVLRGNVITLTEFDFDKVQLNTRAITFTNLTAVLQFYTSLSFVQYQNQHYSDSQEFALRLGEQVIILKESTPTQAIETVLIPTGIIGGSLIPYLGLLVCVDSYGGVSSFDGSAWRYFDGSGSGQGIYNSGTVAGYGVSFPSRGFIYLGNLVVYNSTNIGYYDGTAWINYDSGVGFSTNKVAIFGPVGNNGITSSTFYSVSNALVVTAGDGKVSSYASGVWTLYNAGAGLCNNGTAIGTNSISSSIQFGTALVIAGAGGRLASWNGTAWTNYNAGAGLCNNATAIGTNAISVMEIYNTTTLVIAGLQRLASYTGVTWTNYNAGAGLCDNGTALADNILGLYQYGARLIVSGGNGIGRMANYDGAWHNYNAGTIFTGDNIFGVANIRFMSTYNTALLISRWDGMINQISSAGVISSYYSMFPTLPRAKLLEKIKTIGYLYVYRYEAPYQNQYLVCSINNNLGESYILTNNTNTAAIIKAQFAFPQVKTGKTRHVITSTDLPALPLYTGTQITATGVVGYYDFINFDLNFAVYEPNSIIVGNGGILHSKASHGYTDLTFRNSTSATNVYNYINQFKKTITKFFQVLQGNTDTLIDAYGKLTNNKDVPSTKPFEIRVGMISGQAAFLSAALIDSIDNDAMGVLITNIGEYDDSYQPQIKDDDKIMYYSGKSIVIKKIGMNGTNKIQQISQTLYKVNTLSPINIINTDTGIMHIGSCDYNNRMVFSSTVAPGLVSKVVSLFEGEYSNSVDTGDKLVTINPLTSGNIQIIGARIPIVSTSTGDYAIDTYIEDNYAFSTLNDGSELVKPSKENLVYAETPIIPVAIGQTYSSGITTGNNNTIFLKPDYDGYSIGNDIPGVFTLFKLFGQTYLFDGVYIYSADIDSTGIFGTKTKLAPAGGLRYIASSPTEITFLSTFDNSVYTFTGGRNLSKAKRFTSVENINSGVFDVRENTLVLDTDHTIIFIRDSLATLNIKKTNQTGVKYFPTAEGVIITNNINSWQYTYDPLSGSTVVPLDLKTGYYGFENTNNSILQSFIVTIYNENRTKVTIDAVNYTIQADHDIEQSTRWVVNPNDYNAGGYARLRIIPEHMKTLGSGLRVTTNDKIMLVSLQAEIENGEKATVAKNRTV